MDERQKREMKSKMKWQQVILVLAIFAFIVGLGIVSAVSYFQTEQSFANLNDSNIIFLGLAIGNWISNAFSLLFQYGQNAVLYFRKKFLTDEEVFEIMGFSVTQKVLAFWIFLIFAGIDALTNCVWFYQTVEPNSNIVLDIVIKIIGYTAMLVSVFVEEVIGFALDAFGKALSELKEIIRWETRMIKSSESSNRNGENMSPKPSYQTPQNNQNNNNTNQNNRNQNNQNNNRQPYSNERRPEQTSAFRQSPANIPPDFGENGNGHRDNRNSNTDKFHTL